MNCLSIRKVIFPLFLLALAAPRTSFAQTQTARSQWQLGVFAPYLIHPGGVVGYTHDLQRMEGERSHHRLQLLGQVAVFAQPKVTTNLLLNPELGYRWSKSGKPFFLMSSLGPGYLLAFQRQEESINLATGEADYRYDALNYFFPNVSLGLGREPRELLGFYLKATYGRKMSAAHANAGFIGLSAGLTFRFKKP